MPMGEMLQEPLGGGEVTHGSVHMATNGREEAQCDELPTK